MNINIELGRFLKSKDTLRIFARGRMVFSSDKDQLLPLMDYLALYANHLRPVVIFDKITGNAAALLAIKAACRKVYSPLGSQLAIKTLDRYGVQYEFSKTVPYIQRPNSEEMCPMEALSIGKEPEEFFRLIRERLSAAKG